MFISCRMTDRIVQCSICLDVNTEEFTAFLCPAIHCFHKTCIQTWIQQQIMPTCPNCRQYEITHIRRSNNETRHVPDPTDDLPPYSPLSPIGYQYINTPSPFYNSEPEDNQHANPGSP